MSVNSLRKHEILRKEQFIAALFRSRKKLNGEHLTIVYAHLDTGAQHRSAPAAVLFAVGRRKVRDAVSRNRIRRLLKEAYRLEKYMLTDERTTGCSLRFSETLCLAIIYSGTGRDLPTLDVLRREISRLLFTIINS